MAHEELPANDPTEITQLLGRLGKGDAEVEERLLALVYQRLLGVANQLFGAERENHTLQPTAVVHEAWMKLAREDHAAWSNRGQFFAVGATLMRRILIDHARARGRHKRGDGAQRVSMTDAERDELGGETQLLDLDEALQVLARLDERQHRIVELRFFSGLTVAEVAECLDVSQRTVEAEWTMAKAWLRRRLGSDVTE